ncbi:ribonuclease P protein component [Candidatus Daviesbacteria bacterium]|nr:ribonuclease P protein component [Candidatus Daviesbacteria bacterium]
MLPKSQRLNLKKDFKWVASGKRIDTKFATLFLKTGDNNTARVGIAVSATRFKKATQRNRARRLLSQAFQSTYYLLPSTINIIALPKLGVLEVKSTEVLEDLKEVLRKI